MNMNDLQFNEIRRQLARIEEQLDRVGRDHESRLRWLERGMYVVTGVALAGLGTGLASVLGTGPVLLP